MTLPVEDIERTVDHISRYPRAAPLSRASLHTKTLMKFPYTLVYSVGDAEIVLLAVAHQKRRPFYWSSRL